MPKKLKILHISPTYFSPDSVMGGGERYVLELAKNMSKHDHVKILSFGKKNETKHDGALTIVIRKPLFNIKHSLLNPFVLNLYKEIKEADVIHMHQMFNVLTEVCIIWARLLKKPIFLTDHGGGGRTYLSRLGITKLSSGILAVSEYSSEGLKNHHDKRVAIYGGVDEKKYFPQSDVAQKKNKIIAVGRILPHKGFHHLIEALTDTNEELVIIGRAQDAHYLSFLHELSIHKNVRFIHDANDETLRQELASACLAVFPSTNIGPSGERLSGEPELLGIAPLEAMAMNIPTIVSNIGAYPEICLDQSIFMFEHGNVADLKKKINLALKNVRVKDIDFHSHVKEKFTWTNAVKKSLDFYREYGGMK